MDFYYEKIELDTELINDFSQNGLHSVQNYNPLYDVFFEMGNYWKNVNLKLTYGSFKSLKTLDENIVSLKYGSGSEIQSFVKYSPLIEPIKYIEQKIDLPENLPIPNMEQKTIGTERFMDINNRSYIDGFFSYLTSLLKKHGFIHGLDFYGMYLGKKNNFKFSVEDEIDELYDCSFFNKGQFRIHDELRELYSDESRKWKPQLKFVSDDEVNIDIIDLNDLSDISQVDNIIITKEYF